MHPILNGNCYVMHQGFYNDILRGKDEGLILWPEQRNTLTAIRCGISYVNSVVTEEAAVIAMYDYKKVWIWSKEDNPQGEWVNPDMQTYGTSHELLMSELLHITCSIPLAIVGKETVNKLKEKLKELYS